MDKVGIFGKILQSRQLQRILAYFSGVGFANFENVEPSDIDKFLERFPTTEDFEPNAKSFLEKIKKDNTPEKYEQYVKSVAEFTRLIFGNQNKKVEPEDAYYIDMGQDFYSVFDGVGGQAGGREASQTCARTLRTLLTQMEIRGVYELYDLADELHKAVTANPNAGCTTCLMAKVITKGDKKILSFVTVGDSRLYVARDGKVYQMTQDEGSGNKVYNALGDARYLVRQGGEVDLAPGDRIVLCTDGVIGNMDAEIMTTDEIAGILKTAPNDLNAAQCLVERAKTLDDRTAIVKTID